MSVCRICLAGNMRLHPLKNNLILNVYEKLTNTKFNSEDARPRALCGYCYQKLLRCHTFSQMADRSEQILSHLFQKGLEATHEYITEVNLGMKQKLSLTTMQFISIGSQETIKHESTPTIDIKYEETTEQDQIFEVESVPDDCAKTFEEDESDHGNETIPTVKAEVTTEQDQLVEVESVPEDCAKSRLTFEEYESDNGNETIPTVDIKAEVTTEQDQLIDVESVVDDCAKSRLTFEEDNSNQGNYVEELPAYSHVEQTKPDNSKIKFSCNNCNKMFFLKSKLASHIKKSHAQLKEKQYSRKTQYTEKNSVITYKIIGTRMKLFDCNVCYKQFKKKFNLVRHKITHTGERPFACNVCDKQFNRKGNLDSHMKTHTEEKQFTCNICNKQFHEKKNLVRHKRTHAGEKTCNVCDKQNNENHNIVTCTCMRNYTDEMPFPCNVCNKTFNDKSTLVRHMRTHTGEKPFACNVCERQFGDKSTLVRHMRIHTGESICL